MDLSRRNSEKRDVDDESDESDEFVLASITDSGPLRYLQSLLKSWFKDGLPPLSRQGRVIPSTSTYVIPAEGPCIKTSGHDSNQHLMLSFVAILAIVFLKFFVAVATPVEIFGNVLEYILNLFYKNGGFRRTIFNLLTGSLKLPHVGESDYYSSIMLLDTRTDLDIPNIDTILSHPSSLENDEGLKTMATVSVMAAKFAYENEKVIKKTVEESWKMNFVQFYDCWNDHLETNATQAFMFTDKKRDANIVVVAFRGTQPFITYDWATDFDFSYYVMPGVGRVHVGFLEALGLGNRKNKDTLVQAKKRAALKAKKLLSHDSPTANLSGCEGKVLAYDAICAKARALLKQHPRAKFYVTGHSLGAALAAVYTSWLFIEDNDLVPRLGSTFTFGQPRVGDLQFSHYLEKKLTESSPRQYFRVVFRTDIVPRVPLNDLVFQFQHSAPVHYYKSVTEAAALHEEPYADIFVLILQPMPHITAIRELFSSLFRKLIGKSTETDMALLARFAAVPFPGLCSHNPSFYVDAVRKAPSSFLITVAASKEKPSALEYIGTSAFRFITLQSPVFV